MRSRDSEHASEASASSCAFVRVCVVAIFCTVCFRFIAWTEWLPRDVRLPARGAGGPFLAATRFVRLVVCVLSVLLVC